MVYLVEIHPGIHSPVFAVVVMDSADQRDRSENFYPCLPNLS